MDENSEVGEEAAVCFLCHKTYDSVTSKKIFSGLPKDSIHRSCCLHLKPEHLTENFLSWDEAMPLPFCKKCLFCAQKLSRMNEKLEEIQKKIDRFVSKFSADFLNSRKHIFNSKSTLVSSSDSVLTDETVENFTETVIVKQEEEEITNFEENLDDIYSGYDSSEELQDPLVEMEQKANTDPVVRRGRGRPRLTGDRSSVKSKCKPQHQLKSIRISIKRLEFDTQGNPIPDIVILPRRKAAIKAEATFSSWVEEMTGRSKQKRSSNTEKSHENDYDMCDEASRGQKNLSSKSKEQSGSSNRRRRNILRASTTAASRNKKVGLKCKICGNMFSTPSKLKIHLNSHKDGRPFTCDECNFPFKSRETLRRHQDTHSTQRMFQCPHCDKSYKYRRNLKDHVKAMEHHNPLNEHCDLCAQAFYRKKKSRFDNNTRKSENFENELDAGESQSERHSASNEYGQDPEANVNSSKSKTHICEHCGKVCPSSYKLKLHIRSHTGEKTISCDICGKLFYDRHDAKRHAETHFAERTYKCNHCDKSYKYQRNVKEHIIKHHPEHVYMLEENESQDFGRGRGSRLPKKSRKEKYRCSECEDSFRDKVSLHCHLYSHQPEGTEISCYECNTKLDDLMDLRQHILSTHAQERQFLCSFCGDQFKNQMSQTEHEILHYNLDENEIKEKYFPCPECPKIFVTNIRLKAHSSVHCKERPYGPCEVCGATFKTIHIYKSHQRIHHVDRTKFQCSVCSKLFSSRGCLNKHMYLHSAEKLFSCFCGKKFSTRSGLTAHSVYHRTDRPYLCEECGQGFYTGTKLREHNRIHTGLLLYCSTCSKGFKNSTLLKQHQQVHDKSLVPFRPKRPSQTEKKQRKSGGKKRGSKLLKLEEVTEIAVDQILQFQCSLCDDWFEGEEDINKHMDMHNDVAVQDSVIIM